ncbi:MAG: response regulator transcription factor [Desulfurivibrio sp.]|nr:response regulator transcription factor [Desulfurivibrio sp.]MBU4034422.1 response regulator transcription factor [Pseudomonadota bacterium]MBU4119709.1 response regulator transcription factor [Pseudomonadota bacterium]
MTVKKPTQEATDPSKAQNRRKVLVAEDNPVVRKGLNNFLVKWGYEPIEADNGDTAWNTLETDPTITLAILDWNIPGLSGMQVCQRIRMRTDGPYVYTVIFSARSSIEEQVLALEGGADDYLVKPAKPSLLRARLGVGVRILEILSGPAK